MTKRTQIQTLSFPSQLRARTARACVAHHSLVHVLREDEVGRRAGQRADAADVGGVGDAEAHGFANH